MPRSKAALRAFSHKLTLKVNGLRNQICAVKFAEKHNFQKRQGFFRRLLSNQIYKLNVECKLLPFSNTNQMPSTSQCTFLEF